MIFKIAIEMTNAPIGPQIDPFWDDHLRLFLSQLSILEHCGPKKSDE